MNYETFQQHIGDPGGVFSWFGSVVEQDLSPSL